MKALLKCAAAASLCLLASAALAMPGAGAGGKRFAAMDADGSGAVSAEEFKKTFPNMQDGAFAAIDKNGDGSLSAEEWDAFMKDHAMSTAGHPKKDGATPSMPPAGKSPAMPLVTPPAQK